MVNSPLTCVPSYTICLFASTVLMTFRRVTHSRSISVTPHLSLSISFSWSVYHSSYLLRPLAIYVCLYVCRFNIVYTQRRRKRLLPTVSSDRDYIHMQPSQTWIYFRRKTFSRNRVGMVIFGVRSHKRHEQAVKA